MKNKFTKTDTEPTQMFKLVIKDVNQLKIFTCMADIQWVK